MKHTLGILGLGSQSTLYYVNELNRLNQLQRGGFSTCPFVLLNSDFDEINTLLPKVSEQLIDVLEKYLHALEHIGVAYILIPNITLHQTIDVMNISTQLIHPIQLCIQKLKQNKVQKITLFGTKHTMQSEYLLGQFEQNNIQVFIPKDEDFDFIENFRNKVYDKEETANDIEKFKILVEKYKHQNPVVLACTELSIYSKKHQDVNDMVQLQIEEAIKLVTLKN